MIKRDTRMVSIQGVPMMIYESPECISDDIVKYGNFWEFELFNKWLKYFPTDGLYLDIGANIGSNTLQFKKNLPNVEIWAFEIDFNNFKLLKQNLKSFPNLFCFNIGVGSNTSLVNFNDGHHSNSGVVSIATDGVNQNLVMKLDNLDIQGRNLTFIKLDIEHHELAALEGMEKLILTHKPIIWVEDFTGLARKFLTNLGYEIVESVEETNDYLLILK
jgi:FkbM family methyltransferase